MKLISLPFDMLEVIFTAFTLLELARMGATCRTFRAFYRSRLAAEQKVRKELATTFLGVDQITCLIKLIVKLLQGAPLDPDVVDKKLNPWFYSNSMPTHRRPVVVGKNYAPNEMSVQIQPDYHPRTIDRVHVEVVHGGRYALELLVRRDRKGISLLLHPTSDQNIEGVALVHALLEGGLAQYSMMQGSGPWSELVVHGLSMKVFKDSFGTSHMRG
jgi:hypothetical protein